MANNRMFLMYRPTQVAIALGKNFGYEWSTYGRPNLDANLQALYDHARFEGSVLDASQDDFCIITEDGWRYAYTNPTGWKEGSPLIQMCCDEESPSRVKADGQALDPSEYQELAEYFAYQKYPFGIDADGKFHVPDMGDGYWITTKGPGLGQVLHEDLIIGG